MTRTSEYRDLLGEDFQSFLDLNVQLDAGRKLSPAATLAAESLLARLAERLGRQYVSARTGEGDDATTLASYRLGLLLDRVEKMFSAVLHDGSRAGE